MDIGEASALMSFMLALVGTVELADVAVSILLLPAVRSQ